MLITLAPRCAKIKLSCPNPAVVSNRCGVVWVFFHCKARQIGCFLLSDLVRNWCLASQKLRVKSGKAWLGSCRCRSVRLVCTTISSSGFSFCAWANQLASVSGRGCSEVSEMGMGGDKDMVNDE